MDGRHLALVVIVLVTMLVASSRSQFICRYPGNTQQEGCGGNDVCADFLPDECEPAETGKNAAVKMFCDTQGVVNVLVYDNRECSGAGLRSIFNEKTCYYLRNTTNVWVECQGSSYSCIGASSSVWVRRRSFEEDRIFSVEEIQVGDQVESFDELGRRVFSEVFLVQHSRENAVRPLLEIEYEESEGKNRGSLRATREHLVYSGTDQLVPARSLQIGSEILVSSEQERIAVHAQVKRIGIVYDKIRNLHTLNDRIVVGGVHASCYPAGTVGLGPALMAPLKLLYRLGAVELVSRLDTFTHILATGASRTRA